MSFAPDYTPTKDFSQDEAVNASGRSTVNTAALDAELANVESSVNHINNNLKKIQRDDDELRDYLIKPRMFSDASRALISGGWNPRGVWTSGVSYGLRDFVEHSDVCYVCCVAHTSKDFSSEITFWMGVTSIGDVTALVEQAEAAKQGAQLSAQAAQSSANASSDSASSSALSATASANSATTSTNSSLLAGQYKDAAANSATSATANANLALASKTAAEAAATAAANSAASINPSDLVHKSGDETISGHKTFTETPSGILFPGQAISMFCNTPPPGTLVCNGGEISRALYAKLFAAIGTTFGAGNGSTTFNLPNMEDGFAILGGGTVGTITTGSVISHNHTATLSSNGGHEHSWPYAPMQGTSTGTGSYSTGGGALQWTSNTGAHSHTPTINNTGGINNLAAGMRLLICIAY